MAPLTEKRQALLQQMLYAGETRVAAASRPILPRDPSRPVPLSFSQERLWFLDKLVPGSPFYVESVATRLATSVDAAALERAVNAVVERHEILRTAISVHDGQPLQRALPAVHVPLAVTDLSALPSAEQEREAERIALEQAMQPFDLQQAPLLRTRLVRLAAAHSIFLVAIHHIVTDGWSMSIFSRELSEAYAAFIAGRAPRFAPLPIQYADYAAWQRDPAHAETLSRQLDYWRAQLRELPQLALPLDLPRPRMLAYRGAELLVTIPPNLSAGLRVLGKREQVTLFMSALAAFAVLLQRYTQQDDVAVGTPVAGRNRAEIEPLIGLFLNTLVLRLDLSGDPSFRELLRRVKRTATAAYEHQDLAFDKLVEELQPERDLGKNPLFQVLFQLFTPPDEKSAAPQDGAAMTVDRGSAILDMSWHFLNVPGGIQGRIEYSTELFEAATIEQMFRRYLRVLGEVLAHPDAPLSQLELVAPDERARMLTEWQGSTRARDDAETLPSLFAARVADSPDAVALISGSETITFAALDARADRIAAHLHALGVRTGDRVAVSLERSPDMVAAALGAMKCGAAYVPLDPSYPELRRRFILEDSGARVVLDGRNAGVSPADPAASRRRGPETALDAAYVIYTSGSTGRPKGVVGLHGATVNRFRWMWEEFPFQPGEVACQKTAITFVDSVWETFGPLLAGVPLVIIGDDVVRDARALVTTLARHGVTRFLAVPSLLDALLDSGLDLDRELPQLRWWFTSGEALSDDLLRRFRRDLPQRTLVNLYGSSEAAGDITCERVEAQPAIGRPIANCRAYVLDRNLQLVPPGIIGELHVGGPNLARGYLDQPALTAARFLPDPFTGRRMYATGDRARWLADGRLAYHGRADHQIKLRGYRIELGEIEAVLREHPRVRQAAVDVDRENVVAFIAGDAELSHGELRDFASSRLPAYMTPAAFVILESLPLTPSGKLDRLALAGTAHLPLRGDEYVPPSTEAEAVLARIWSTLLHREAVGANDHFFDLGGHSLLAIRLVSRIRADLGIELPLRDVFLHPTLSAMARRIESTVDDQPLAASIVKRPREEERVLSFAQQRLWFLDQLVPGSPFYTESSAMRIHAHIDVAAFERALNEIVQRHEVLRTTFHVIHDQPVPRVAAELHIPLPILEPATEDEALRIAEEEARRPFDLANGPLLRTTLLRMGAADWIFLVSMHHIVCDAWSSGVFSRELSELYAAFVAGRPSPLAELPIQYADFAWWQREWLRGDELERQLGYWREQLDGVPQLELPADHPRPPLFTYVGAQRKFHIPAALKEGLERLGQREGATLFMTLLSGFYTLLHRLAGQDDLVVGVPVANRGRHELEDLIGFFVNVLAMRIRLDGEPAHRELLQRVRAAALDAYAHQDLPFEKLVEELQPERDLARNPIFQVILQLHENPQGAAAQLDRALAVIDVRRTTVKFDLRVDFFPDAGGLRCVIEYSTDLFDSDRIERLAQQLRTVYQEMVRDPEQRVGAFALLGREEEATLDRWGGLVDPLPPLDATIDGEFDAHCARNPDAIALAMRGDTMTYAELQARANMLASELRARGVARGELVAVTADRCPAVVIALLGILKAGAAYVPIDSSYPDERVEFMLRDTRARVLIDVGDSDSRWRGFDVDVLSLRRRDIAGSAGANAGVPNVTAPDDLAYVLYTSGSTGSPKGVCVTHRGVVRLVSDPNYGTLGADQTMLLLSPLTFDATTFEIWSALLHGAKLAIYPERRVSLEELEETLIEHRVTTLFATAGLFHELVESRHDAVAGLRQLFSGGDVLSPRHVRAQVERFPDCRFVNAYGPTENSCFATCQIVDPADPAAARSIGKPGTRTHVYVLDRYGQRAPIGTPGELCVGGDGLARCYLDEPALTAERFVPDPFSRSGGRMYRTGDLVRFLPAGNLEFLGRIDRQVKIRGFRIEPGEIERAILTHDGVENTVVVARDDGQGKRLVAYVVPKNEDDQLFAHLRGHLQERLPEHMIPAAWVWLDAIPLTRHQKVDRAALPPPLRDEATPASFEPARTDVEERLTRIWMDVLGRESVCIHDNFFELGGDSILSIRVVSRANAAGIHLTVKQMFEHQTIAQLAAVAGDAPVVHAEQGVITGPTRLTAVQAWLLEQDVPNLHHFNQTLLLEVPLTIDVAALDGALRALLRQHDALRLRYDGADAFYAPHEDRIVLELRDLTRTRGADLEAQCASVQAALDLAKGAIFRAVLFLLGGDEPARLLLTAHHFAVDGISWRILLEDLWTAYAGGALPAKTTSLRHWAERTAAFAHSSQLQRELDHWTAAAIATPLPVDAHGPNSVATVREVHVELSEEETHNLLTRVPAAFHTQVNDALLCALARALGRWTERDEVSFDVEGHGREPLFDDADVSRTVGWFTSIFPVRLRVAPHADATDDLPSIASQLASIPNHGVGFGILAHLGRHEALRRLPPRELSFNYLGQFEGGGNGEIRAAAESPGPMRDPRSTRAYLIEIDGSVTHGRLAFAWSYSEQRHRRATIETLAQSFIEELRSIAQPGELTAAHFPDSGLAPDDLHRLFAALQNRQESET